jgi:hypothetical protein
MESNALWCRDVVALERSAALLDIAFFYFPHLQPCVTSLCPSPRCHHCAPVQSAQVGLKSFSDSVKSFKSSYANTDKKVKIVDLFLLYTLATGLVQFVYCVLVGNFPFNSFLSGFGCALGAFVLGGM